MSKDDKIILTGILSSLCECGKCNIPSYPGRIYGMWTWNCKKQSYTKNNSFEQFLQPHIEKINKNNKQK